MKTTVTTRDSILLQYSPAPKPQIQSDNLIEAYNSIKRKDQDKDKKIDLKDKIIEIFNSGQHNVEIAELVSALAMARYYIYKHDGEDETIDSQNPNINLINQHLQSIKEACEKIEIDYKKVFEFLKNRYIGVLRREKPKNFDILIKTISKVSPLAISGDTRIWLGSSYKNNDTLRSGEVAIVYTPVQLANHEKRNIGRPHVTLPTTIRLNTLEKFFGPSIARPFSATSVGVRIMEQQTREISKKIVKVIPLAVLNTFQDIIPGSKPITLKSIEETNAQAQQHMLEIAKYKQTQTTTDDLSSLYDTLEQLKDDTPEKFNHAFTKLTQQTRFDMTNKSQNTFDHIIKQVNQPNNSDMLQLVILMLNVINY